MAASTAPFFIYAPIYETEVSSEKKGGLVQPPWIRLWTEVRCSLCLDQFVTGIRIEIRCAIKDGKRRIDISACRPLSQAHDGTSMTDSVKR